MYYENEKQIFIICKKGNEVNDTVMKKLRLKAKQKCTNSYIEASKPNYGKLPLIVQSTLDKFGDRLKVAKVFKTSKQ